MINKVREIHDFIISGGRAASISPQATLPEAIVTGMINGVLVSKPLKKVTEISETKTNEPESKSVPVITILNDSWDKQHSKAASVLGINKVKEIHEFINGKY